MLIVFKLVEAGAGRREQHYVTRPRQSMRTFDGIVERLARQNLNSRPDLRTDFLRCGTDRVYALHALTQERVHQRVVAVFVFASENEMDIAAKRLDGFDGRVDIRRFGVVVILNPVDGCDMLQSMFDGFELPYCIADTHSIATT